MITDALSWHWIFYVNLPVGAVAMVLIGVGLEHRSNRVVHRVDYVGALWLSVATCCALLALSWGGTTYLYWSSSTIVGLGGGALGAVGLLTLNERRAAGAAAAAALVPRPRLRSVRARDRLGGHGPVRRIGVPAAVFPARAGGQPDGRRLDDLADDGRRDRRLDFRWPVGVQDRTLQVAGNGRPRGGRLEFRGIGLERPDGRRRGNPARSSSSSWGWGSRCDFPNLTTATAIQNAVEQADLGAATATAAFFRSLGGAVGVALSGAIMTARLQSLMPGELRALTIVGQMPIAEHAAVVDAYRHALSTTFLAGAVIAATACLTVALSPERPLGAMRR